MTVTAPHVGSHRERRADTSTRYLCAGAHLDRRFSHDVLRQILAQPQRAVGPSNGVDTALVIRHCVAAHRRQVLRDGVLVALLALALWALVDGRAGAALAALVAAWGVVLVEAAVVRFDILAGRLRPGAPYPELRTSDRLGRRLAGIAAAESRNVAVYNAYDPFVGSGAQVGAWSFVIDLAKGKEELGTRQEPRHVELAELRARVTGAVRATGIDNLRVDDVLHVSHHAVARLPLQRDRAGRPAGIADPAAIRGLVAEESDSRRLYQRIQVTAWDGEIVLTVFLRLAEVRNRLYAEATYLLLSPVEHAWHVVDEVDPAPMPVETLRLVAGSACRALPALVSAAPRLLADAWHTWVWQPLKRWEERVAAREGGVLDCGTGITVRQRGASTTFWRYFQRLDQERYLKVVERSVLDTLTVHLDEHGVDTSELVERQTTILNQGVLMSGGTLQAESLAVGRGARIGRARRRLSRSRSR